MLNNHVGKHIAGAIKIWFQGARFIACIFSKFNTFEITQTVKFCHSANDMKTYAANRYLQLFFRQHIFKLEVV